MSISEQLVTARDKINFLLENYPNLREDDKKLWISYLVLFHNLQDVLAMPSPYDALCKVLLKDKVVSAETMRRIRQKIQEKGNFKRVCQANHQKTTFNVKGRVEHLLSNYPALRDNDTQLWLAYLTMFHGMKERINESVNAYEEFCDIILDKEVPSMESIRRSRQVLQEKGLYVGDKRQARLNESKKIAEWARS